MAQRTIVQLISDLSGDEVADGNAETINWSYRGVDYTIDLTAKGITTAKYLRGDNTWQTPPNTTYAAMSVAEGETGTATSSRTVRADYLKQIIQFYIDDALSTMNADATHGWL